MPKRKKRAYRRKVPSPAYRAMRHAAHFRKLGYSKKEALVKGWILAKK